MFACPFDKTTGFIDPVILLHAGQVVQIETQTDSYVFPQFLKFISLFATTYGFCAESTIEKIGDDEQYLVNNFFRGILSPEFIKE